MTRFYAAYALLAVAALATTYCIDPYVFGFTTLGVAAISGGLFVIALCIALFSKRTSSSAKTWIVASAAGAVVASAVALAVLRTFKWA